MVYEYFYLPYLGEQTVEYANRQACRNTRDQCELRSAFAFTGTPLSLARFGVRGSGTWQHIVIVIVVVQSGPVYGARHHDLTTHGRTLTGPVGRRSNGERVTDVQSEPVRVVKAET